ncbi:MAG: decarboxylase [Rhodospirillaceae bacterium]|nr:decarboxylase [Rhodospirillaceae bacterium]HAA93579.1 sulfopyruvate decarboxylase subunit alpha [Rhodospirillaceae bacterium]|tara:strand:+ start:400 stop:900 length:501 start_codon:yes stop_codon:yes gene_type:complete
MDINERIVQDFIDNDIGFVTTVPCKQLAGVIEAVDQSNRIRHVPCNHEAEGMGLCAGAFLGGTRPCIIMQNTAIGVTVNSLAALIQYYQMPLPMLISYRGEVGEKVACQVEMAMHTKPILQQMNIPTYHFHHADQIEEFGDVLNHTFMASKPTAILTDASFWSSAQ